MSSSLILLRWTWTSTAPSGTQSPIQPDVRCLQGWGSYRLSGQPYCKALLPYILSKIFLLSVENHFPLSLTWHGGQPACLQKHLGKTCFFNSSPIQLYSCNESQLWTGHNSILQWIKWIQPKISLNFSYGTRYFMRKSIKQCFTLIFSEPPGKTAGTSKAGIQEGAREILLKSSLIIDT